MPKPELIAHAALITSLDIQKHLVSERREESLISFTKKGFMITLVLTIAFVELIFEEKSVDFDMHYL